MSEESTRDKGMREGGRWINYNDERTTSAIAQQKKEGESPVSPTAKGKEEPDPQEYWADVREDSEVSDETYRCIDVLRRDYTIYWMALMRHETGYLTNEEALEETKEEARGKQAEASDSSRAVTYTPLTLPTKKKI